MGGPGSGRWEEHAQRTRVETCVRIDVNRLVREGIIRKDSRIGGSWTQHHGFTGEGAWIRLRYTLRTGQRMSEDVPLQTSVPHFGGVRWWLTCPRTVDGEHCNRRVGKLYLPPGERYFGCRRCYELTYESCSHKDEAFYRLLAEGVPGATPAMTKRGLSKLSRETRAPRWSSAAWGVG